jgi:hypothetical protein
MLSLYPRPDVFAKPSKPAGRLTLEGNAAGNRELNFRAGRGAAENLKPGSNALSPLPHSGEPPVSVPARSPCARVDSASVVTHQQTKLIRAELQYKFHVMACNNDGVWKDAGAMLDFSVSPAWFQTTWFFVLCTACGICLVETALRKQLHAACSSEPHMVAPHPTS